MLQTSRLRFVVGRCTSLHMRFDKEQQDITSSSTNIEENGQVNSSLQSSHVGKHPCEQGPPRVTYRSLPESMMPKRVSTTFTPFPLPKYDHNLGYGPVRLHNIPDIAAAETRRSAPEPTAARRKGKVAVDTLTDESLSDGEKKEQREEEWEKWEEESLLEGKNKIKNLSNCIVQPEENVESNDMRMDMMRIRKETFVQDNNTSPNEKRAEEDNNNIDSEDDYELRGYRVERNYPMIDRIECVRSAVDLVKQFNTRIDQVARGMTLADMGAILHKCTDDEVVEMLNEVSSPLAINGEGINFNRVVKRHFGVPYMNTSVLTHMYIHFIDCLTETFVHKQPYRLLTSPKLFIQLLSFLALAKILEPNRWHSRSPNNLSNRADYSHARGINLTIAHKNTGVELFEYMSNIIANDPCSLFTEHAHLTKPNCFTSANITFSNNVEKSSNSNNNKNNTNTNNNGDDIHVKDYSTSHSELTSNEHYTMHFDDDNNNGEVKTLTRNENVNITNASEIKGLLSLCSTSELLDMLGGFAGVHVKNLPPGNVIEPILCCFLERLLLSISTTRTNVNDMLTFATYINRVESTTTAATAVTTSSHDWEITNYESVLLLERAYFITQMFDVPNDYMLRILLGEWGGAAHVRFDVTQNELFNSLHQRLQYYSQCFTSVHVNSELIARYCYGAQFFSAVSRDKRVDVKMRALTLLEQSLNLTIHHVEALEESTRVEATTTTTGTEDKHSSKNKVNTTADEGEEDNVRLEENTIDYARKRLYTLVQSGTELLMSLPDKQLAFDFARRYDFDRYALESVPEMKLVAERLPGACGRSNSQVQLKYEVSKVDVSIDVNSITNLQDKLNQANALIFNDQQLQKYKQIPDKKDNSNSITLAECKVGNRMQNHINSTPIKDNIISARMSSKRYPRTRAIRTFFSNLSFINGYSNVFLFHSSVLQRGVSELISAVRRVSSGKDGVIFTMSCIQSIYTSATYGVTELERSTSRQALNIIAYELEKNRATLLSLSEEILLHDAGVYCDEDLMLWSLATYMTREMPLVKVLNVINEKHIAFRPHNTLRGEQTALKSNRDLHDKSKPLLNILQDNQIALAIHLARLQKNVLDRPRLLYEDTTFKARLMYRRDKPLYDKFHVLGRFQAAGYCRAALDNDTRGLGLYTPDHPQVPFRRDALYRYLYKHNQEKYSTLRRKS